MTGTREWRQAHTVRGPVQIHDSDLTELNAVFSEAFTERYRRDGMSGVRVPPLNPAIWRYALADADGGALLWRSDRGEIAAFNIAHRSGVEGWMGPLAVRPEFQGRGIGQQIVQTGIKWLKDRGAEVVGLETMPRTMDNIGFYSRLGFVPGPLTITLALDVNPTGGGGMGGDESRVLLGRVHPSSRDAVIEECTRLTTACAAGVDFSREIRLTQEMGLGDTCLLRDGATLVGFALFHTVPLVEGRARDELRVLKLVLRDERHVRGMTELLARLARRIGTPRVALRMQADYTSAYRTLIEMGARVRWTDLRMSLIPTTASAPRRGVILSNWEI